METGSRVVLTMNLPFLDHQSLSAARNTNWRPDVLGDVPETLSSVLAQKRVVQMFTGRKWQLIQCRQLGLLQATINSIECDDRVTLLTSG